MGKNDRNNKPGTSPVVEPVVEQLKDTTTTEALDTVPGLLVENSTEVIEPANGEMTEGTFNGETDESTSTETQVIDTVEQKEDESALEPEVTKEPVLTPEYGDNLSLTEAIECLKDFTAVEMIEKLHTESKLDLKLFASELKDIIALYSIGSELETTNGNRKLYNLLLRTLKVENAAEFKFKFDVINKLFIEEEKFEPITLLSCSKWTKSEKDLANFSQIITIIEDLADRSKRQENKKRIANLSNISVDELSIENIKKYYKL